MGSTASASSMSRSCTQRKDEASEASGPRSMRLASTRRHLVNVIGGLTLFVLPVHLTPHLWQSDSVMLKCKLPAKRERESVCV